MSVKVVTLVLFQLAVFSLALAAGEFIKQTVSLPTLFWVGLSLVCVAAMVWIADRVVPGIWIKMPKEYWRNLNGRGPEEGELTQFWTITLSCLGVAFFALLGMTAVVM